jgi:hypothetical protein
MAQHARALPAAGRRAELQTNKPPHDRCRPAGSMFIVRMHACMHEVDRPSVAHGHRTPVCRTAARCVCFRTSRTERERSVVCAAVRALRMHRMPVHLIEFGWTRGRPQHLPLAHCLVAAGIGEPLIAIDENIGRGRARAGRGLCRCGAAGHRRTYVSRMIDRGLRSRTCVSIGDPAWRTTHVLAWTGLGGGSSSSRCNACRQPSQAAGTRGRPLVAGLE